MFMITVVFSGFRGGLEEVVGVGGAVFDEAGPRDGRVCDVCFGFVRGFAVDGVSSRGGI